MTVGLRIAQKRKELGLSQEGLGERLGVSRQTVYKWESDAALPEIEKLVNLSREFSVSIDWLLGEGDEARELTPEQLRMVEEIVGRYLAAQPRPEPAAQEIDPEAESETGPAGVRWLKRWGLAWVALAALVAIVMVFFSLFDRLGSVRQDYQVLQNSVFSIREDVNRQINSITQRVEEVLQSQNTLAAEQSAQVVATDYRANTITVSARAVPRTYVEGMTAEFILASDGEAVTVPGALGDDHAFTAQITGPLSDDIAVSVAFCTGDQRQTQLLNQFAGLYTESFPLASVFGTLCTSRKEIDTYATVGVSPKFVDRIKEIRLGLFRDQKLLAWYERLDEQPERDPGGWALEEAFELEGTWVMEPGHEYCRAVVLVDEYDREWICPEVPAVYDEEKGFASHPEGDFEVGSDPADWDY